MLSGILLASRLVRLRAPCLGISSPQLVCARGARLRCCLLAPRLSQTSGQQYQAMASCARAGALDKALDAKADLYGGVIVDASALPSDAGEFERRLQQSLKSWGSEGIKGVWLKLPLQQSHLVPIATGCGFAYHHAESEHLMLTTWLHDSPSTLPANASHQVGVGAVVPNRHGEILVLKEKSGPAAKFDIWKLPTGLLSTGEDYQLAAVREVKEETGLDVEFEGLLAMRQAHGFAFGKSDMFLLCGMKLPESTDPDGSGRPQLVPDDTEIAEAKWMPMAEYGKSHFVEQRPVIQELTRCMEAFVAGQYSGFANFELAAGPDRPQQVLAHGLEDLATPT